MNGYNCCLLYRSLKLHFTTEYDYIKYNGKVNYTYKQYKENTHQFVYDKLAKKYNDNVKGFFISNFLELNNIWIQDICTQESFDIYTQYNKTIQSLSYVFKNDLLNIFESDQVFKVEQDNFPILLVKLLRKEVSLETVVIMNDFLNFIPKWELKIKDDFIWPNIRSKMIKYKPFLEYDKVKFKSLLLESIKENT
jgi:hypothetical protein